MNVQSGDATPFDAFADEYMGDGSDVIAMFAIHWPEDSPAPWAEIHGTGAKQDVAMILHALAASLTEQATGSQ